MTNYLPLVQEFLAALGDDAASYDASRVRGFIFARASRQRHARPLRQSRRRTVARGYPTVARRWRAVMLSQAIDCYIAIRRVAGFELKVQEGLLRNFARYAADRSQTHVQRQTAIDWAAKAPSPYQRENRSQWCAGLPTTRTPMIRGTISSPGTYSPSNAGDLSLISSHPTSCVNFSRRPLACGPGGHCGQTSTTHSSDC